VWERDRYEGSREEKVIYEQIKRKIRKGN